MYCSQGAIQAVTFVGNLQKIKKNMAKIFLTLDHMELEISKRFFSQFESDLNIMRTLVTMGRMQAKILKCSI